MAKITFIIHSLEFTEKNFECFTSKPNAHGTFKNVHIKINLTINMSEINGLIFVCFPFSKSNLYSIWLLWNSEVHFCLMHKLAIGPYLQQDLYNHQDHNLPPSNPF